MNNLTKKLTLLFSIVAILSLASVVIYQSDTIQSLKKELKFTSSSLSETKSLLEMEIELNEQLRSQIRVFEDSIQLLQNEISALEEKISAQKVTIRNQDQKMQKLSSEVNNLTRLINDLSEKNVANERQIKILESERDELLKQMEVIDKERMKIKEDVERAEQEMAENSSIKEELESSVVEHQDVLEITSEISTPLPHEPVKPAPALPEMDSPMKSSQQERMNRIVNQTQVNFTAVTLRSKENGRAIGKVKDNNWRYTQLEFDLLNPDHQALLNEEFVIQLYDLDHEKVVPLNENNPLYPESDQGSMGYRFTYLGKPLQIDYFNSQKKTGQNFEIRVFYSRKGILIPIKNGITRMVKDGYVVAG